MNCANGCAAMKLSGTSGTFGTNRMDRPLQGRRPDAPFRNPGPWPGLMEFGLSGLKRALTYLRGRSVVSIALSILRRSRNPQPVSSP
jgi:hypothetical protein